MEDFVKEWLVKAEEDGKNASELCEKAKDSNKIENMAHYWYRAGREYFLASIHFGFAYEVTKTKEQLGAKVDALLNSATCYIKSAELKGKLNDKFGHLKLLG